MRREVREREKPQPSVIWQTLAVTFSSFAFACALAALTLSKQLAIRPLDLAIAAAGFALAASLCFAAHRDVNRGRKSRLVEVEELSVGDAESLNRGRAG